jgi:tetratricopeptide (TPR) repeat protein
LLETTRQYAREKLEERGEDCFWQERHRGYYLELAEEAAPQLDGPEQAFWFALLEREGDNFRTALSGFPETLEGIEAKLKMADALWIFWWNHGYWGDAKQYVTEALSLTERANLHSWIYARTLQNAGALARAQGDDARAVSLYERSVALFREHGDAKSTMQALLSMVNVALHRDKDFAMMRAYAEEALELMKVHGTEKQCASPIHILGYITEAEGDFDAARAYHARAHEIDLKHGQVGGYARESLGNVARIQGDYAEARILLTDSLEINSALGNRHLVIFTLESLAWLEHEEGEPMRAARLCGAAKALRDIIDFDVDPLRLPPYERGVATLQTTLGDAAFETCWEEGRRMTFDQAVAYGLRRNDAE